MHPYKALKALNGEVQHPKGFLFRTAHELAIEHLRQKGRYNHDLEDIATLTMNMSSRPSVDEAGAARAAANPPQAGKPPSSAREGDAHPGTPPPAPSLKAPALPDGGQLVDRLEEAVMTLPTRRMTIFFDRRVYGRSLKSIAEKLDWERASTAREIAIAASTVYLTVHPEYPANPQEQERLLNAFGWRIRTHRQKEGAPPTMPDGMSSWLRANPLNETIYADAAAFWDDPQLGRACERVERRIKKISHAPGKKEEKPGGSWVALGVLLVFAALGVGIAWLYPEIFDQLLSLLIISA